MIEDLKSAFPNAKPIIVRPHSVSVLFEDRCIGVRAKGASPKRIIAALKR